MDRYDEILNQLKDSKGELKDNFHILEEIVPIEEQLQYFDYCKRARSDNESVDRNYLVALLFSPTIDLEEKKYCLSVLAGMTDIGAYRALETYHSSPPDPELAHWSALALIESRILIDSDLSGEKQILVSTGLGGHKDELRFFVVIATKDRKEYTELQKEILDKELKFQFDHENVTVEEYEYCGNYLGIVLLSKLSVNLKAVLKKVVDECNQFGDFIDEKFIITNIKKFTHPEVQKLLKSNLYEW